VTIRHLLTHTSGLPDQLAGNDELRKRHAPLSEFAGQAIRTPLGFAPGSRYEYSSMGILLATQIGERLSGSSIFELVDRAVRKTQPRAAAVLERVVVREAVEPAREAGLAAEAR